MVGNVQPSQLQQAWRKPSLSGAEGKKVNESLVSDLLHIHFHTAFGGAGFFLTKKDPCHEVEISLQSVYCRET